MVELTETERVVEVALDNGELVWLKPFPPPVECRPLANAIEEGNL